MLEDQVVLIGDLPDEIFLSFLPTLEGLNLDLLKVYDLVVKSSDTISTCGIELLINAPPTILARHFNIAT